MIIKNHSTSEITSLKDASYQGCISSEKGITIGQFIYGQCPSFLESIPDEVKSELEAGQMLRFNELNPAQWYTQDWVPCEAGTKSSHKVDINVVMSFSSQEFGKMKNENPIQHGIHAKWRKDFQTYKSNRFGDLRRYVRAYIDKLNGTKRERAPTKDFAQWLKDEIATIKVRAKNAKARGDTTVDDSVINAIAKAIK